jgi:hypothetical protein
VKSISQYLNGRVLALGARCCRFKSCLADSLGRSFNGRKSRLHRDNGSSTLPRSNATVAQWQCISFVKSRLSVRLRPVALSGRLAEWFIAPVLKTGVGRPTAGSNPAPSDAPLVQRIEHLPSKQVILVRFQEGAPTCVNLDPEEPNPTHEDEDDYFDAEDSKTWLQENGPLAQWSEQSPHKGLAVGSNPTRPTIL